MMCTRYSDLLAALTIFFIVSFAFALPAHAACPEDGPPDCPTEESSGNGNAETSTNAAGSASAAYNFSKEGIFGCNRNVASLPQSVGSFSATGGVYVPVADYTVELNTGILVYQQCILRGLVDRMSESALTALNKNIYNAVQGGRDGKPLYPTNLENDIVERQDEATLKTLQNRFSTFDDAIEQALVRAAARQYSEETRDPDKADACPYEGDLRAFLAGTEYPGLEKLSQIRSDSCLPQMAYYNRALPKLQREQAQQLSEMFFWLDIGRGFYPVESIDENGVHTVVTPSSVVQETAQLSFNSGYLKTLQANDVDQMVGALFSGLGTQIVSSSGGLAGLSQRIGNQPSYIEQVAAESASGLRNAAGNAALQVLAGARQVETQYNNAVTAIANTLTNTIGQLRNAEKQCWGLVISNVCASTPSGTSCTGKSGAPLRIATSTAFSQPIITAQIAPLANQTVTNIQTSQKALSLIDQLIAGVTNTTSLDAQRIALVQLDQLVAQKKLHKQEDVTAVQQQQGAITDTMSTLVDDTVKKWADDSDPNVGWCNINNQAVINLWDQRWRQ